MSDNELQLAGRIVRRLQQGLDDIDPGTLARLRSARTTAVQRMQTEPASVLAWAGVPSPVWLLRHFSPRYLVPIVGMVLTVSAMVYWQQQQRIEDPVDIDARLLSSDLPIDALLDKGLDTWLQR
jgi:hypothetical protein